MNDTLHTYVIMILYIYTCIILYMYMHSHMHPVHNGDLPNQENTCILDIATTILVDIEFLILISIHIICVIDCAWRIIAGLYYIYVYKKLEQLYI